jgi:RNA polymerase sigma-70 factor (ECF subfamily)
MTDEQAMQSVKAGDLDKAAILFERYKSRLFNFFLKFCGDEAQSQDMTQNTFYRLLKYRQSFNEENPFKAWIYQIARNILKDSYKENQTKMIDLKSARMKHDTESEPMVRSEREQLLHNALKKLPDDQREILILSRFEELKYEEIGQILGISVANVKVKAHRAIQKLREIVMSYEL